jgi:hypothetical protein
MKILHERPTAGASEEASDLPPAGWYPDPEQAQTQRLGDGASR